MTSKSRGLMMAATSAQCTVTVPSGSVDTDSRACWSFTISHVRRSPFLRKTVSTLGPATTGADRSRHAAHTMARRRMFPHSPRAIVPDISERLHWTGATAGVRPSPDATSSLVLAATRGSVASVRLAKPRTTLVWTVLVRNPSQSRHQMQVYLLEQRVLA